MDARYVFAVEFRIPTPSAELRLDPATFETKLYRAANPPGEDGWLFFRDNLWRGAVGDEEHMCKIASEKLGVDVESVEYRAFETDDAYLDELKTEIARDLDQFNADSVSEVLSKYFKGSLEVR
ncbi:LWR-salt protein [Natranaeroarchaeum aerophilus]|uniref:LWR-salt protein n=1 Tax=Natranaeroarchaeum aerophilus TaxID=2917711 RepID=A0AAE3FPB7_9EURY|nr:LWR-salt protein [Natranaeroarchaeum aerophilus]